MANPARARLLLGAVSLLFLFFAGSPLAPAGYDPAGLKLPPGFTVTTYITGAGFHENERGIPAVVAMSFHADGTLYFARTANRLKEIYGRSAAPIYRVPPGEARITPETESKFLFGEALEDPDELGVNPAGDVFVSTRNAAGYGSVYRISPSGKSSLFAGGPPASGKPLFQDPEGVAFDNAGNVYVVDNDLGTVVKLDSSGKVLDPRWISRIGRGRTLTFDPRGYLWIGSDGPHDSEHMDGSGEILRFHLSSGKLERLHSGPLPSGMGLSPGGNLFVAQRRSHRLFALTPDGKRIEFASFTGRSALRTLAFPPVTEQTRRLGIAGDLFVMVFPMLDYPVREVIRISGPFDAYVAKQASPGTRRGLR
jgi:DNA-binding beta-propeller fold protein YncE